MRPYLAFATTISLLTINVAVAQVMEVTTVVNLQMSGAPGGATNVNVDGYASKGDGGGGQFVQYNCGGNTDDGEVIIQDPNTSTKCWYRQFSGSVHMSWYGVTGANPTATSTQFVNAFKAAKAYGNRTVVTDGLAIGYSSTTANIDIPTGDSLDCQGTIGGFGSGDWTVPTLSASLIIDPAVSVLAHSRSTLQNCNIRPNWFTTSTQMDGPREIIDNVLHKFAGTGVICTDDGCAIQNVAVFAFDVGIKVDLSQRFYMNNVLVDSNTGIWWRALPGAARNTNLLVDPLITQGHGVDNEDSWKITAIAGDAGQCKLTLDTSSEPNAVVAGDTVYVVGVNDNVSVTTTGNLAMGDATVTSIDPSDLQDVIPGTTISGTDITPGSKVLSVDRDTGSVKMDQPASGTHVGEAIHFAFANTGPAGCNGRWIVDAATSSSVTLKGSSFSGPSTTGTWSIGSNVITVTSLANIEPGQGVTGSGLSGTVVNVLPAANPGTFKVILSANATANGTNAPVSFTNSAGFSGDGPMLTLSAATRVWTANGSAWGPNAFVTSGIGDGSTIIGTVGDTTRVQPGMYISVDGSPIGNVTAVDDLNHTITVQQNVSTGTHTLTLTGCGYPGFYSGTKYPWLGNCAATAYLLGGPKADTDEDQGLGIVQAISKGWQVGFHLINALDTRCTGCQVNGNGSVYDRREFGIWFDDGTDETLWAGGGVHATGTALLQTSGESNNCDVYNGNDLETSLHDGWGFAQLDGCLQVIGTHNHNAMDAFIGAAAANTVLQGNYFPSGDLFYENGTAVAATSAVGNTFRTGVTDHLVKLGLQALPTESLTIGQPGAASGMCLYNTADQTTNYERACLRWSSNTLTIATEKGGAGTAARDLNINSVSSKINLQSNGTTKFTVGTTINGSANGAQIASANASATAATLIPNRAASSSTGMGADAAGDISLVVGANEDVRFDAAHHTTLKGGAPSSTGNTVVGNDLVGRVTLGSGGSTVTIIFNQLWANTPICFAQDETTAAANPLYASIANTVYVRFSVTASTNMATGDNISYRCLGYR